MKQVIIVGGGPGGLQAARRLAAEGVRVQIFEEHDSVGSPVHCTGVLADEAFAEFDLPRTAVLNAVSTARFFAPSGAEISHTTRSIEALVVDRSRFDADLSRLAQAAGARLVRGRRVAAIDCGPEGARVSLAEGDTLEAAAVILACGASYTLQRRLGLGLPAVFNQSAQVEVPASSARDVEVYLGHDVAPKGFAWTVPVQRADGMHARVGLMCEGDAGRCFDRLLERVADRWGIDRQAVPLPRRRMMPLAPIGRTYGDRLLVIGDAAGLVKATTGGGIYYSLLSGTIAADTLVSALRAGDLRSARLAEYEREWRRRLHGELQAQLALRMLAQKLSDVEIDGLFELARTNGIMPIVRRSATFNRHRSLIVELFRHPPARQLLFRRLVPIS